MMKFLYPTPARLLGTMFFLLLTAGGAPAHGARLQTAGLDHLSAKANQTVDVNIDEHLIQLTAKFLSSKEPDEVKVKEIVNGLKGIYVKSFEFEKEGEYSVADLDLIRNQ